MRKRNRYGINKEVFSTRDRIKKAFYSVLLSYIRSNDDLISSLENFENYLNFLCNEVLAHNYVLILVYSVSIVEIDSNMTKLFAKRTENFH